MNRSADWDSLLPEYRALQHGPAPRPLPLFLELVREVAARDPDTARAALAGLTAYQRADRARGTRPERPADIRVGALSLRDCGGDGPPAVLVPSLINPPHVLDLDDDASLAADLAALRRRALLVDWGPASERRGLDIAGHVEQLLLPALGQLGERPALIGYCLGGTMAIAAAQLAPVERIATLAAPWHFARYPGSSRSALARLWRTAKPAAQALGALPMEVLQSAFWALDPDRVVAKFADFASLSPGSAAARRFVALEDWANEGEPVPLPAARELIEDLFGEDRPGAGCWQVGGRVMKEDPRVPALHLLAGRDRIAPAAVAPAGPSLEIAAGHVGMVVGSARKQTVDALARFLGRG